MFRRLAIVSALAVIALVIFFVSGRSASAVNYRVFDRLPSVARGAIHDGGVRLRGHVAGAPRATIHAQGRALDAGDGTFELEAFSEPTWVWASSPGLASRPCRVMLDAWPTEGLALPLLEAASLVVLISSAEGVVSGAEVSLLDEVVRTDASGGVVFSELPAEAVFLEVKAPGFQALVARPTLQAGVRTTLALTLAQAAVISGEVFGADDAGLPGASVRAYSLTTRKEIAHTVSGPRGDFELTGLDLKAYRVNVEKPGATSVNLAFMAPTRGVVVHLEPGATIRGVVRDATARPVRQAEVKLSAPPRPSMTANTDQAGRFEFAGLSAGAWSVSTSQAKAAVDVMLSLGELKEVDLPLTSSQRTFEGVVLDAETGAPLEAAVVSVAALELELRTTEHGKFEFESLGNDAPSGEASAEGYVGKKFTAGAAVTVKLERREWLSGRVVDGARVPLTHFGIDGHTYFAPDGRFIAALLPNADSLHISARGYVARDVEARLHELGDVVLEDATHTVVTVLSPAGQPVAGAQLWMTHDTKKSAIAQLAAGWPYLVATTDLEGHATLTPFRVATDLEPSCVFASAFPWVPSSLDGCPEPGGEDLVLQLSEPAWIEGLVGTASLPERGVAVMDVTSEAWAVSDAQGHYLLGPLTPGRIEVAFARQFTEGTTPTLSIRRVEAKVGTTERVDLSLTGGCVLEVDVRVLNKADVATLISVSDTDVRVNARPDRLDSRIVASRAGVTTLRFEGLPPGPSWVGFGYSGDAPGPGRQVVLREGVVERVTVSLAP